MHKWRKFEAVVIGGSSGAIDAIRTLVSHLPGEFPVPVICVLHLHPHSQNESMIQLLSGHGSLKVLEAEHRMQIKAGRMYLAPPNYHLLVEPGELTLSLNVDEKVNMSRPSIDVLFESAADAYGDRLIGIMLSGASHDGAAGLQRIKEQGGITIVQDPETAQAPIMPKAAMVAGRVDFVLPVAEIAELLLLKCPGGKKA